MTHPEFNSEFAQLCKPTGDYNFFCDDGGKEGMSLVVHYESRK